MENQTTPTVPNQTTTANVSTAINASFQQPQSPQNENTTGNTGKTGIKGKLKLLKDNVVLVFKSLNPKIKKLLLGILIVIILLLLAILVKETFLKSNEGKKTKPTPTPSISIESPDPNVILNPSRYATDSGVISIDESLKIIEGELNDAQINDTKLSVPVLLWDVNFEE